MSLLFRKERDSEVREALLRVLKRLLQVSEVISPEFEALLAEEYPKFKNEVDVFKKNNSGLVKKQLWIILGEICKGYGERYEDLVGELKTLALGRLDAAFRSLDPETPEIEGLLKCMQNCLSQVELTTDESRISREEAASID